jgi:hypothetical protein
MYGFVVRHRTRLGWMLGEQACSVRPSEITEAREP